MTRIGSVVLLLGVSGVVGGVAVSARATDVRYDVTVSESGVLSAPSDGYFSYIFLDASSAEGFLRGPLNGYLFWRDYDDDGTPRFGGTLTLHSPHGDVYLAVSDMRVEFDGFNNLTVGGAFAGHATVTGGTQTFQGATGDLDIAGAETSSESGLTGSVRLTLDGTVVRNVP